MKIQTLAAASAVLLLTACNGSDQAAVSEPATATTQENVSAPPSNPDTASADKGSPGVPLFSVPTQEGSLDFVQSDAPPLNAKIFHVTGPGTGNAGITVVFQKNVQVYVTAESGAQASGGAGQAYVACFIAPGQPDGSEREFNRSKTDTNWQAWNNHCGGLVDLKAGVTYKITARQWNANATVINTDLTGTLKSLTP